MRRIVSQVSMALIAAMMAGVAGVPTHGQPTGGDAAQAASQDPRLDGSFPDRQELRRRIALFETAEKNAEQLHPGLETMVKIYDSLRALYEDAGMYPKAEDVMHKEIAMLKNGPQDKLASALGHLAIVHIAMVELHQAEKDDSEALRIRESLADPIGVALIWSDLGDIYIKEKRYKQALEYAQKALAVLDGNPKVDVADRIAVRQTLAYALCGVKQCEQAIPLLENTLEMEKKAYGEDSLLVGSGYFLLGYVHWQNGDMDDAAKLMARGTARMKVDLGWGHSIYLDAMSEYARFLRQRGQMEAAASAEREIKMANAVVDARSLTRSSGFAAAGSR